MQLTGNSQQGTEQSNRPITDIRSEQQIRKEDKNEALDVSTPYIVNHLATYSVAYAVMSEVYDAYQKVYGSGTLKESRRQMAERLFGQDLKGNKVGKSVSELVADYLARDRYVFVNKSNTTAIPVNKNMYICTGNGMTKKSITDDYYYYRWCKTPDFMTANPLSQKQLKDLAAYCADRKETIFDFIINDMQFVPDSITAAERKAGSLAPAPFNIEWSMKRGIYYVPTGSSVYGNVVLATAHSLIFQPR